MAGPSGLGCMKSFNSLVTCGKQAFEAARGLEADDVLNANKNGLNDMVRKGAEITGLDKLDPLDAARATPTADHVQGNARRLKTMDNGM